MNPTPAEALFFQGVQHLTAGAKDAAETCFRQALALAPSLAEAQGNLALLLDQSGRCEEAEQHYRQALACNPGLGQVHLNLGGLLVQQKRFAEAEQNYRMALRLMPDSPAAWSNLGVLQACRKQEAEAECSYQQAIALDPSYRRARFNFAYLLLRQGRFEEGWEHLEARDWYEQLERYLPYPRWQGEPLAGKSLLIGIEAGHGDMIQFCRYASRLKERGATRLGILCHPALKVLFATLADMDTVIALDEPLPDEAWDYWSPPLSLPFHCRTRIDSVPSALPYLYPDPELCRHWAARLDRASHPGEWHIGLVWKGNPHFENDADRSLPGLDILAPLGTIPGLRLVSLQKGAGEEEAHHPPPGFDLLALGPEIGNFADTAAIISQLDLVISVDTATAHLAGALGHPCWVLLPDYKTDWRWLAGRRDSPWYPEVMRLFRQTVAGDWLTVIMEVGEALKAFQRSCPPESALPAWQAPY